MRVIDDNVIADVTDVLETARLFRYDCNHVDESATALLEKEFADYVGRKYCIAMNSCSSALFVSMLCCGVKPGDKVLMPAFTFVAVPSAIVHANAQPVLIEVTDDYVIDCDDLERKITTDTKYLMLSHMRGRIADMDRVTDICTHHNITLIEDTAHSLGVLWENRQTGFHGKTAAYSTQSYKMIDGGEGGLMVTDDMEIAARAMLYAGCYESNWKKHAGTAGFEELIGSLKYTVPAYNFRMSNLTSAALRPQLNRIEARVERYNKNYDRLAERLDMHPNISVPSFHPKVRKAADSIQFHVDGLSIEELGEYVTLANSRGITLNFFGLSGDNARCFWLWRFFEQTEDAPITRELLIATADLRLPLAMTANDIDNMAEDLCTTLDQVVEKSVH